MSGKFKRITRHDVIDDGARSRRPLIGFLALSLVAHMSVLGGFPASLAPAPMLRLGQLVLDVQLQDRTPPTPSTPPSAAKSLETPVRPAALARPEITRTVDRPSLAETRTETEVARAAVPPAISEAGLRNQILGELQTQLSRYLTYPPLARRRGWEGTVLLGLRIEPSGRLENLRVERSSGYALLDDSALNSLSRMGRLAEAPGWLDGRGLDMQLPVIYRLIEN